MAKKPVRKYRIPTQQLVMLKHNDLSNTFRAAGAAETAGGQVMHIFGPRVVIGDLPKAAAKDFGAVERTMANVSRAADVVSNLSETEQLGIEAWQLRQSSEFDQGKAARVRDGQTWNMSGGQLPPDGVGMRHVGEADVQGAPETAVEDMSPYLIGSVAVGIVIVEGPTADLQFSTAERAKVVAEVQEGLTWLGTREPRASVTWSYDIHTVRVAVAPDPTLTGYEPLEALWRNPALAQLGFTPNSQGVRDYVASIRNTLGTRWGYTAFFTKYPLQHFAYASKPRLVMNYSNDGWGPDNIDRVFTHESGHIFGCPDEYLSSQCSCNSRYGYLQEINGNCESCASPFEPCLMAANTWAMCRYTPAHFGWRDSDGDGVLDPIDTAVNPSISWQRLRRRFPSLSDLLADPAFDPLLKNESPHEQVPLFLLRRVLTTAQMSDVEAALAQEEDEFLARLTTRFGRIAREFQATQRVAPRAPVKPRR